MTGIAAVAIPRRGLFVFRLAIVATALALGALWAPGVSAGTVVDLSTLTPVPPDGYTCWRDGANTICRTSFEESVENGDDGPVCGDDHLYETIQVDGAATRWYDEDGLIVAKLVRIDLRGTFSLSPTGAEPTVTVHAHQQESYDYPIHGDVDSEVVTVTGMFVKVGGASAPGLGADVHAAGRIDADGVLHGLNRDIPGVDEALCRILAP